MKYLRVPGGVRVDGEGEAEFVSRCASTKPEFSGISVPIIVARDFDSSAIYLRFGKIGQDVPKFEEHLRNGDSVTSLLGATGSEVQATIGAQLAARLTESRVGMPRIDFLAFRPIADRPISVVLRDAASPDAAKIPDPWGREPFKSVAAVDSEGRVRGWTVTLRHLETVEPGKLQSLWYRIVFSPAGDEVVIARIDKLPAAGDRGTMPSIVTLLEDYRLVNRIHIPIECAAFSSETTA